MLRGICRATICGMRTKVLERSLLEAQDDVGQRMIDPSLENRWHRLCEAVVL